MAKEWIKLKQSTIRNPPSCTLKISEISKITVCRTRCTIVQDKQNINEYIKLTLILTGKSMVEKEWHFLCLFVKFSICHLLFGCFCLSNCLVAQTAMSNERKKKCTRKTFSWFANFLIKINYMNRSWHYEPNKKTTCTDNEKAVNYMTGSK